MNFRSQRGTLHNLSMFDQTLKCLALIANLLLVGTAARSVNKLANVDSTPTQIDVALFDDSGELTHPFHVSFGKNIGEPKECDAEDGEICLEWRNGGKLSVKKGEGDRRIISVNGEGPLEVCYKLNGDHLYGGPVVSTYPAEHSNITELPYMTGDFSRFGVVLAVAERYWYTSSGLNIKVAPESPLFITQHEDKFCLIAKNEFPYLVEPSLSLQWSTCINAKNLREGLKCFFQSYEKPIPPKQVIASPIWSTWVEFKRDVSQEKAIKFYNDIKANNFKLSVMEIDDAWETCYGSEEFDKSKFPDAKAMVDLFHSEGYLTTLWVHPFVGPGCESLDKYAQYLVKDSDGSIGKTVWWNGNGTLINFMDPKAVEWFQQRLVNIQKEYGFDSFKFDAGEVAYVPGMGKDEKSVRMKHPNQFTTNYVKAASKFGALAEARVGAEAHTFDIMQRVQDTNSVWGAENWGLRSVLLSVFQLSLHGYGAVLPDMIGGNCYGDQPTKEMFIRWIQLNTFLPIIQFSLTPWKFDQETIDISRKFTDLHYEYADKIMKEFKDTSHPVINPIWWIDPEDSVAQTIDSEFLLGEDLLVAPVLEEGAVSRDIYFPKGSWKDLNTGKVYTGPGYVKGYSAPLDVLPYFEKV